MKRVLSLALRSAWACALVLAASTAHADPAVTGIAGDVLRIQSGGINADGPQGSYPHPGGVPRNTVNYSDCNAGLSYLFQLNVTGTTTSTASLVAYVGASDCTPYAAHAGSSPTCWPLTAQPIDTSNPPATAYISMRDLALAAAQGTPPASYTAADATACLARSSTAALPLAIYFFFVDANNNALGTAQAYPITVDTRAQNVTGGYSVSPFDSQVQISITAATDPDTVSWNVYCDPPPGHESSVNQVPYDAPTNNGLCDGAAALDEAGGNSCGASLTGGGPSPGGCYPSTVLVSGGGVAANADAGTTDAGTPANDAGSTGDDGGGTDAASSDAGTNDAATGDAGAEDAGDAAAGDDGATDATTAEAGTGDDGGAADATASTPDAGTPTSSDAGTSTSDAGPVSYTGGTPSNVPKQYLCATAPAGQGVITVNGLTNGDYYNIAVAAVDGAGNVGPLATGQCTSPQATDDFFTQYTSEGGKAGGGFCSTEGAGVPAGTSGLGFLFLASVTALVRKRRARR